MASTYLQRTVSSAGNRKTWTYSVWVKRSKLGASNSLMSAGTTNYIYFPANDHLQIEEYSGSPQYSVRTNRVFRDTNAWYHIVVAMDTTQATASDRIKLYVNGVRDTDIYTSYLYYPSQNFDTNWNNAVSHTVGSINTGTHFDGSMSHIHFIDGTAYDASAFGETDSTTGEWKIKTSPSVSYGTNGFFILKDGNSVTDQSGNGNNWTVAGGTLTKTEDCPSNVFATWNPIHYSNEGISNVTFKHGNTTFDNNETGTGIYPQGYSTLAVSSGKYYCEHKIVQSGSGAVGISTAYLPEAYIGDHSQTYVYRENGVTENNGTTGTTYTSAGVGDIIQLAVDLDNNKLYAGVNGTWVNSGDPANGTGAIYTITSASNTLNGVYHFTIGDTSSSNTFEISSNFGNGYFGTTAVSSAGTNASGNGIFEFDCPQGYTALSTKGLNE